MTKYIRKYEGDDGYVRKIDDIGFDLLETGIKSKSGLNDFLQKKYDTIFNKAKQHKICRIPKNKSDITWVASCWEQLRDWMKAEYSDGGTLRINLEALANILLAINKNKFREEVRVFFNTGKKLQNEKDDERDESLFPQKDLDNLVVYDDLVKEQKRWYKAWILDPKNKRLNMYHLILALNTMIPPIRKNYHELEFYRESTTPPRNIKTNYLWEKNVGQWILIINYDKVENKREAKNMTRSEFDLSDEIPGITHGKQLNKIINESLKYFPRDFVLSGIKTGTGPMGSTSYDKALQAIFKPKRPTQNLIRKAWVNHFYRKPLSTKVLNTIAFRMRHSVPVARASYFKINYPVNDGGNDDYAGDALPPPIPIQHPKSEPKKEYFNPAKYAKEYRAKNKDKIKEKRKELYDKNKDKILKDKVLWHLNKGVVKHPSKQSVERYGIKYNPALKKWE